LIADQIHFFSFGLFKNVDDKHFCVAKEFAVN
jgi:hypothetical protein